MAYLAAANVTVTLLPQDIEYVAGRIFTFPTVAFGNGALQYPALGIPMPVIGKFGMRKEIKRAFIEQPADGFIYHFDRTNHKLRIFLGAARDAITGANHVGVAPTGNLANLAAGAFTGDAISPGTPAGNLANLAAGAFTGDALANITPTGNLANLAAGAFTGDALANITPTGNLANLAAGAFTGDALANITPTGNVAAPPNHSHDLVIASNATSQSDDNIGANTANNSLVGNIANAVTIPGGNAATGGVANAAVAAGAFTGDSHAPGTPTGNVANGTGTFVGAALANITPTGNVANGTGAFVGDTMANLVHTVTGGGAVAEAALAEMDDGVAPAATTLYMQIIGQ